jgi:hypothetical protein
LATLGDFRPTFGGVLATFGLFCPTLRRFHQAGSTFCGLLAKSLSADFCTPFLGSIFDPFFGLRVFGKLLVLRDFLKLYGVFGPLFARTFHRDFHLPREGVFHVLVFTLGVGLVQFVDQ